MKRGKRNNRTNGAAAGTSSPADISRNWRQRDGSSSNINTNINNTGTSKEGTPAHNNKNTNRRQQQHQQQQGPKPKRPLPPITIFTYNFRRLAETTGAARYKVHRAGSDAPKIKALRLRPKQIIANATDDDDDNHDDDGSDEYLGHHPPYSNLDGLVVVPDVKRINHIYLCLDTPRRAPSSNNHSHNNNPHDYDNGEYWRTCELKLQQEIFAELSQEQDSNGDSNGNKKQQQQQQQPISIKVSCAQCLLKVQPNGFVCIASPSKPTIEWVCRQARAAAAQKRHQHADHAHAVAALSRHALDALMLAKTRQQTQTATAVVVEQLQQQIGTAVVSGGGEDDEADQNHIDDNDNNDALSTTPPVEIKLGHHLVSLLHITRRDVDAKVTNWFVLAYNDTVLEEDSNSPKKKKNPIVWTLDLPGGKRHLGETSLEAAIRETEEESSLVVGPSWVNDTASPSSDVTLQYRSNQREVGNAYYMMRPPASLLMEDVEGNAFWNRTTNQDEETMEKSTK